MTAGLTVPNLFQAAAIFMVFVVGLFGGSKIVPGPPINRPCDSSRQPLEMQLNGLRLFLIVGSVVGLGQWLGAFSLASLHELFFPLLIVANLFAMTISFILFFLGRRLHPIQVHATAGETKKNLRDFFFGVEQSPRWSGIDLKLFSYRPSLIGLALLNGSFAAYQYQLYGHVSDAMMLYQIFTMVYVFNYFHFEHGMLFTWDIVSERFGWMLVWGDYVLVPFFYCLPGWFLIDETEPLAGWAAVGLIALYAFGFWLFRGANEQKHRFKLNPSATIWGRSPVAIGGRLLVSGFWGIGRHLNYTGEICIYLAFALTTGFHSIVPYLLPGWLIALLAHRAWRDDQRCRKKYGDLWTAYCHHAQFRMIPFIY